MAKLKEVVDKLVTEEMTKMIAEAKERAPELDKKLEELRKKLCPEMHVREALNASVPNARPERRIAIKTVSELLDVPINELMLHFLNNVKTKNERSMTEYHLGQVIFYGDK